MTPVNILGSIFIFVMGSLVCVGIYVLWRRYDHHGTFEPISLYRVRAQSYDDGPAQNNGGG